MAIPKRLAERMWGGLKRLVPIIQHRPHATFPRQTPLRWSKMCSQTSLGLTKTANSLARSPFEGRIATSP